LAIAAASPAGPIPALGGQMSKSLRSRSCRATASRFHAIPVSAPGRRGPEIRASAAAVRFRALRRSFLGLGKSNRNEPAAGLVIPRVGVSYSPPLAPDADTLWQKARLGNVHSRSGFLIYCSVPRSRRRNFLGLLRFSAATLEREDQPVQPFPVALPVRSAPALDILFDREVRPT
jgi:hypothetical protein